MRHRGEEWRVQPVRRHHKAIIGTAIRAFQFRPAYVVIGGHTDFAKGGPTMERSTPAQPRILPISRRSLNAA